MSLTISFSFTGDDLSLYSELSGVPSAVGLEENTAVDYPPAENQLGKIPCCHVRTVPEDGDGVDLCLLLDTVLKLFYHMCAQLAVNNKLPHPVAVVFARHELQQEIPLG